MRLTEGGAIEMARKILAERDGDYAMGVGDEGDSARLYQEPGGIYLWRANTKFTRCDLCGGRAHSTVQCWMSQEEALAAAFGAATKAKQEG